MENNEIKSQFYDPEDKMGYNEVLAERQKKIAAARERVKKKYSLNERELNILFKIIENGEIEMERVRRSFSNQDYVDMGMQEIRAKIIAVQEKMNADFEDMLVKIVKAKYEACKKIKMAAVKKKKHI